MTTHLLDTDIAIELLRGRDLAAQALASKDRMAVYVSSVTVAELAFGALRSREPHLSIVKCPQFCAAFQ